MKLISSKEVYKCGLFKVTEEHASDGKGYEIHRSIVRHVGSAVILAVDAKKRILLVRQYRLPAGTEMWELPAGRLDPGENPLKAAKRELIEETGTRARKWRKLTSFFGSPGFVAEKMTVFLATKLTSGEAHPMDDERIESRWFSSAKIDRMLESGKIIDGKTMIGYLLWKRFG
jgi:ADP-ribose pyrophosphatase